MATTQKLQEMWLAINAVVDTIVPAEPHLLHVTRKQREQQPVFITSIANRSKDMVGGRTCDAIAKVAAQRIVEETHRLATPEEAKAFQEDFERRGAENRKKINIPVTPQSMAEMIGTAVAAGQQATDNARVNRSQKGA